MFNKIIKSLLFFMLVTIAGITTYATDSGWGQEFWKQTKKGKYYFAQKSFDRKYAKKHAYVENGKRSVKIIIDNDKKVFDLVELPASFLKWNIGHRIDNLKRIKRGARPEDMFSSHDPAVATYGFERPDSQYSLNNAIKGIGFLPKKSKIKEIINMLEKSKHEDFKKKLDILINLYEKADKCFDYTRLSSLELYSNHQKGTQTFLNQMVNPASVIVFSSESPTFKLKTMALLIAPENPHLSDYEKNIVTYINLIHDFFHDPTKQKTEIAVVYFVTEVYDSTPDDPIGGEGRRIVPPHIGSF